MSDDETLALRAEVAALRAKLARFERCLAFTVEHVKALIAVNTVGQLKEVRGGAVNWLAKLSDMDRPS